MKQVRENELQYEEVTGKEIKDYAWVLVFDDLILWNGSLMTGQKCEQQDLADPPPSTCTLD